MGKPVNSKSESLRRMKEKVKCEIIWESSERRIEWHRSRRGRVGSSLLVLLSSSPDFPACQPYPDSRLISNEKQDRMNLLEQHLANL